jgi:hypothetical protein
MRPLLRRLSIGLSSSAMALTAFTGGAAEQTTATGGPTTSLQTEYIMKMYVPLEKAHVVSDGLRIVNSPAGWIEGPRIKGKIVPPSADWLRTTANGLNRIDVRLTLQTDDGAIIYMSYNGIFQCEKDVFERFVKGQMLRAGDCYLITAPLFETKSERYGWLNGIQAVGKMIEIARGDDAHLIYDIFLIK